MFILEVIKEVHFNKDIPENHNIYVPDKNRPQVLFTDGQRWFLINFKDNDLFEDLIYRHYTTIENKITEFDGMLSNKAKSLLLKHLNNVDATDDSNIMDRLLRGLNILCYDSKDIPIETKRQRDK